MPDRIEIAAGNAEVPERLVERQPTNFLIRAIRLVVMRDVTLLPEAAKDRRVDIGGTGICEYPTERRGAKRWRVHQRAVNIEGKQLVYSSLRLLRGHWSVTPRICCIREIIAIMERV